jgi:hypothetical protein
MAMAMGEGKMVQQCPEYLEAAWEARMTARPLRIALGRKALDQLTAYGVNTSDRTIETASEGSIIVKVGRLASAGLLRQASSWPSLISPRYRT